MIYPPVAQLDNAADSDSEERGFESLRAGHYVRALKRLYIKRFGAFCLPLKNLVYFGYLDIIFAKNRLCKSDASQIKRKKRAGSFLPVYF